MAFFRLYRVTLSERFGSRWAFLDRSWSSRATRYEVAPRAFAAKKGPVRQRRMRGVTDPNIDETEDATAMNKMTKTTGLSMTLVASFDSRFETLETAGRLEKSLQAQLGGKLRKVFSPPSPDSTPDTVKRLLQELEGKVGRAPTRTG